MGRRPSGGRAPSAGTSHGEAGAATVVVARLGAGGDGLATLPDGRPCFIAGALAGETVEVQPGGRRGEGVAGRLLRVLSPSPDRVDPPCPHAGTCGGCAIQHLADASYAAWKRGLAAAAVARAGYPAAALAPLARSAPATRRRADLALRRDGRTLIAGFHARFSAEVVDTPSCRVLHPALAAVAARLRDGGAALGALRREGAAVMTVAREGVDLWLMTDGVPDPACRAALAPALPVPGLSMLFAPRGIGKTYLALSIALAIASDGPALKWRAPKSRRVLYVDGEMPAGQVQERLARLIRAAAAHPPEADYLRFLSADLAPTGLPSLADPKSQDALDRLMGEHEVEVLILDNLSTLVTGWREN